MAEPRKNGKGSGKASASGPRKTSRGRLSDRSGTITTANTSQQLAAVNASRTYLLIQNQSATDLYFNFGIPAVVGRPSIKLAAGSTFTMESAGFVPTEAVNIIGATVGQVFVAKEA